MSEVVSRRQKLMLPLGTPYTVLYFFKKSHTHRSNTLQRFNNFRICQIFFGLRQYGHLVVMANKESILFSLFFTCSARVSNTLMINYHLASFFFKSISSKSQGSSKSATFDEWLEDKKLKRQKQEQKEKEDKWRQEMERRNKRLAKMGGLKSFEDWKNSKTSKQTRDLPNAEKRRDDVVREEPGRKYSIGFERWLNRAGALDLY